MTVDEPGVILLAPTISLVFMFPVGSFFVVVVVVMQFKHASERIYHFKIHTRCFIDVGSSKACLVNQHFMPEVVPHGGCVALTHSYT